MTKPNTENPQTAETGELTTDDLDLVSGGVAKETKPKEKPLEFYKVTLEDVLIS